MNPVLNVFYIIVDILQFVRIPPGTPKNKEKLKRLSTAKLTKKINKIKQKTRKTDYLKKKLLAICNRFTRSM